MKKSIIFCGVLIPLLLVGAFFVTQNVEAATVDYQIITLESGWNIISTPKVLSSHEFSAPEITDNFDIYLLDPTSPSGWQTMQGVGQTQFQPLFAYFINNKKGQTQTLKLNYNLNLTPAQRLFQRTLQPGWNAVGIALPDETLQWAATNIYSDDVAKILNQINQSTFLTIDFTADQNNPNSVKIGNIWKVRTSLGPNDLSSFKNLKGYGVYITQPTSAYIGFENLSSPAQYTLTYTAGANGSITGTSPQAVTPGLSGTAVTAVADPGYHFVNWSDNLIDNPRTDTNVTADISVTANFAAITPGSLTLSKSATYDDQATFIPVTAYKLAHFTLTSSVEGVNIRSIETYIRAVNSCITNLYIRYGEKVTPVEVTGLYAHVWAVNYTLPAGQTIDVMVYGDIPFCMGTAGNITTSILVNGTTINSAIDVSTNNGSPLLGQAIITVVPIAGSSTLTATASINTPDATTINVDSTDGVEDVPMLVFNLKSTIGASKVTEVKITASGTAVDNDELTAVKLYQGATPLGSSSLTSGVATFSDLSVSIAKDATTALTAKADFAATGASGRTAILTLTAAYVTYDKPDLATDTTPGTAITGETMRLYADEVAVFAISTPLSNSYTRVAVADEASESVATGVITFSATADGGTLTKLTSAKITVVAINSSGTELAVTSQTIQLALDKNVPDGNVETVTINVSKQRGAAALGYIYFKVTEIKWTMVSGTEVTQSWGLDDFKTPAVNVY